MTTGGWPRTARLDAAHLLDRIAGITGVRLTLEGPCPGGEVGAAYVRWPDGRRSVLSEGHSHPAADGIDLYLVHLDFHPGNVLVADGRLTGVVDWDGAARGDHTFDLVTLRFDLARRAPRLVPLVDERLTTADPHRVRAYWAHMSLRQVDWSIRHHDDATVDAWLDIAEAGPWQPH